MMDEYKSQYEKLGLNIAYYRKANKLTQMMLAEFVEVDRTHIQRIENAVAGASLDIIFRIADVLKVPVHRLFEFRE